MSGVAKREIEKLTSKTPGAFVPSSLFDSPRLSVFQKAKTGVLACAGIGLKKLRKSAFKKSGDLIFHRTIWPHIRRASIDRSRSASFTSR